MPGIETFQEVLPAENVGHDIEAEAKEFEAFGKELDISVSSINAVLARLQERQQNGYTDFIDDDHGGRLANAVEEMKRIHVDSVEKIERATVLFQEVVECIESIQLYPARGASDDIDDLLYFSWDMKGVAEAAARMADHAKHIEFTSDISEKLFQVSTALMEIAHEKSGYIKSKADALNG